MLHAQSDPFPWSDCSITLPHRTVLSLSNFFSLAVASSNDSSNACVHIHRKPYMDSCTQEKNVERKEGDAGMEVPYPIKIKMKNKKKLKVKTDCVIFFKRPGHAARCCFAMVRRR